MHSESIRLDGDIPIVSVVGWANFPESIRSLDTFASPDYADLFSAAIRGSTNSSAEDWARIVLEETSTGRSAPILWRSLGLRLGPTPSADYVQGWKIADRGQDWVRVETSSWCMSAHAVLHVDDGLVSLALFVRFDHPMAGVIWAPVSRMHRRGVPIMLRQAIRAHESRDVG
jgi:hypothetical protein